MADYQDIRGLRVKYLSADPSVTVAGEVWYNSTTGTLRSQLLTEAWSSGSPAVNSPRIFSGGDGPLTAAWMAGGGSSNPSDIANTEEYNGSGWGSGGDLPAAVYGLAGVGPQSAALAFGGNSAGSISAASNEYDGSTWASPASMPTGRNYICRAGTQTAALAFGGSNPGPTSNTATSEYDGSTWTSSPGSLPVGIEYAAGCGTQTAALAAGGYHQPGGTAEPTATLYYDGSTWTSAGTLPVGRWNTQGFGTQTDAVVAGGQPAPAGNDTGGIRWDGTTWSADASLASARNGATAMGLNSGATSTGWVCGGPGVLTEEYNKSTDVITPGAWASSNNMNTARRGICSAKNATQNAALGALGYTGSATGVANAETYDGSTWSNITAVPSSRYFGGGFGTQTTAVIMGGYSTIPSASQKDITNEWNGSAWSLGGTLPAGNANFAADGCGTETAGLVAGGLPGPYTLTAEYNGSSWTAVPGSLNSPRTAGASFGVQTAAIAATGNVPGSPGYPYDSESYDGTTWTATNPTIYGAYGGGGAGTQTAGILAGGATGTPPDAGVTSQTFDGTNWSTNPSYTTTRYEQGGTGTQTAALIFSGATTSPTAYTNATEEFTGETSAANIVTLTTS